MREILFRGKRVDKGEWVEGSFVAWHDSSASIDTGKPDDPMYAIDPATVGQCTGLTDKNGKKIFEGDIVDHHVQGDILVSRGVVEWDERNGGWGLRLRTMFPSFSWYNPAAYEVIGNIHDNPELLKGGES